MTFEEIKEAEDDEPCVIEEVAEDDREGEAKVQAEAAAESGEVTMASQDSTGENSEATADN